jgi:hypothetical protein
MDQQQPPDLFYERMIDAVRSAEVVSIFFPTAMRSLILDARRTLASPPQIMVDKMVESGDARLRSFARLRPELPTPTEITLMPWSGYVRQFEESGVLEALRDRCRWEGDDDLVLELDRCYARLIRGERRVRRAIVRGPALRTLWQRTDAGASR